MCSGAFSEGLLRWPEGPNAGLELGKLVDPPGNELPKTDEGGAPAGVNDCAVKFVGGGPAGVVDGMSFLLPRWPSGVDGTLNMVAIVLKA